MRLDSPKILKNWDTTATPKTMGLWKPQILSLSLPKFSLSLAPPLHLRTNSPSLHYRRHPSGQRETRVVERTGGIGLGSCCDGMGDGKKWAAGLGRRRLLEALGTAEGDGSFERCCCAWGSGLENHNGGF